MAASHRPSMFYASVPGQRERSTHDSAHGSSSETQIESRLQSIVSSVNFIQEQSDEAISISDQASHCIKALVDQLGEVDSRVKALEASSTSPSTPTSTHRNRIPRELSDSVKKIYEKLDDGKKFNVEESYVHTHNQSVAEFLADQLRSKYSENHTERNIKKAIHRYYESRRRMKRDQLPERTESKVRNLKNSKKYQRQKFLFNRRDKMVKTDKENKYWKDIDFHYMTEESSDEDCFHRHTLIWRSKKLNSLITHLDQKFEKSAAAKRFGFQRKRRIDSTPSASTPPQHAPDWTLKSEYRNQCHNNTSHSVPVTHSPVIPISNSSTCIASSQGESTYQNNSVVDVWNYNTPPQSQVSRYSQRNASTFSCTSIPNISPIFSQTDNPTQSAPSTPTSRPQAPSTPTSRPQAPSTPTSRPQAPSTPLSRPQAQPLVPSTQLSRQQARVPPGTVSTFIRADTTLDEPSDSEFSE